MFIDRTDWFCVMLQGLEKLQRHSSFMTAFVYRDVSLYLPVVLARPACCGQIRKLRSVHNSETLCRKPKPSGKVSRFDSAIHYLGVS